MEKNQIFRTSYSSLQTFRQCPQKFKFQEIDKIKAPKSKEAVFGNKIHEALKFFHSKYPVSPTLDELLNYYKDIWDTTPFANQEEDIIYFSEGIRMLKNYYQYFLKEFKNNSIVLDTESRFEVFIENPETKQKCIIAGKIDRISKLQDGTIEVIDYKTAKKLPSQSNADFDLQLSIYCLGTLLRWPYLAKQGIENIRLAFYYLRHGEIIITKRTEKQLEEAKNEIWDMLAKIDKAKFKPIPSALCDWCGYKEICPMWKNLYRKEISLNDEQIANIVNEFFALKETNSKSNERLNELKKIIENYLNKEKIERVFGKTGYITRLPLIRYGYELEKLRKILEPLEKWVDILDVDVAKLKTVIKTLPHSVRKQIERTKKIEKEYTVLKASTKKKGLAKIS